MEQVDGEVAAVVVRLALAAPATMQAYAGAWDRLPPFARAGFAGCPPAFTGHTGLAFGAWMQGIAVERAVANHLAHPVVQVHAGREAHVDAGGAQFGGEEPAALPGEPAARLRPEEPAAEGVRHRRGIDA